MLEGLILGVFLMAADPVPTPPAPIDSSQTVSSASNPADATNPAETSSAAPTETTTDTTASTEAPAATENTSSNGRNNQDRVRCRRSTAEIGSIMGHRTCSTRRQDQARSEQDQAALERMQQRGTNRMGSGQ